jgi:hypothetical protein
MRSAKSALLAAALIMAAMPSGAEVRRAPPLLRNHFGSNGTGYAGGYRTGPGWGRAKVKRMAQKRRNVLRNRRAHRGRK